MDSAKKKRTSTKQWLTRTSNDLQELLASTDAAEEDIQDVLRELDKYLTAYEAAHAAVEELTVEEDLETEVNESYDYRRRIIAVKRQAVKRLTAIRTARETPANPPTPPAPAASADTASLPGGSGSTCSSSTAPPRARLPKVSLPTFSGNVLEWTTFWEQFAAHVDGVEDLDPVMKYGYLKPLLQGEAASCISGLTLTAANYPVAVELLQKRFGRPERIIFAHLEGLLQIPALPAKRSAKDLWRLSDGLQSHVRSLQTLGITGEQYGVVLTPLLLSRLPEDLRMEWARDGLDKESDLNFLMEFLRLQVERKERAEAFVYAPEPPQPSQTSSKKNGRRSSPPPPTAAALPAPSTTADRRTCAVCGASNHETKRCRRLTQAPLEERSKVLRNARLCFACLGVGHLARSCDRRCTDCNGRHHRLLCGAQRETPQDRTTGIPPPSGAADNTVDPVPVISAPSLAAAGHAGRSAALQTAVVTLRCPDGSRVQATALLDSGSDRSYVNSTLVQKIKPNLIGRSQIRYAPFGSSTPADVTSNLYSFTCIDIHNVPFDVTLCEVPLICAPFRRVGIPAQQMLAIDSLGIAPLADAYGKDRNMVVDLLIGVDAYWAVMTGRSQRLSPSLMAQESRFGWILSGSFTTSFPSPAQVSVEMLCVAPSESLVRSMWELDTVGISPADYVSADDPVMTQFRSKVRFDGERYEVALPWNGKEQALLPNRAAAEARLASLRLKLSRNPVLEAEYSLVFAEYESSHIVESVPLCSDESPPAGPVFYLPHRPVVKETSVSTKVRPVFDASARGPTGLSLNDCLNAGPSLLPGIVDVLLRFRRHVVAITADIKRAFLQIRVAPEDRDAHRFLAAAADGSTRELRFERVPFGNKSSPFLLNATIQHHLSLQSDPLSPAVSELRDNLYVDDWLSGADSVEAASAMYAEARAVMSQAGMELTKWGSNNRSLLCLIDSATGERTIESSGTILGVRWAPASDAFSFDVGLAVPSDVAPTKRVLLSCIARLYDPLGFAAPFAMEAKIMFQDVWRLGLEWDAVLPDQLCDQFIAWVEGLRALRAWEVPRRLTLLAWSNMCTFELHVFADASEKGYGAVVYMRSGEGDVRCVRLVIARARVAPLKTVTLPRLELMAALLASRLVVSVRKTLRLNAEIPLYCWTDSMVTLGWVKGNPSRWKQFVANRVSEIQSLVDPSVWRHVPGSQNPADLLTRGLSAANLMHSECWINGPDIEALLKNEPPVEAAAVVATLPELCLCSATDTLDALIDADRFSTHARLTRALAWALRFSVNCRVAPRSRRRGPLTPDELAAAERVLLRQSQRSAFPDDLRRLSSGLPVLKSSPLFPLAPFLDEDGLLRKRSRLQHAVLSHDAKNPVILPCDWLSLLLVRGLHVALKHAGIATMMASVRSTYWIIRLRCLVKRVKRGCVDCRRFDERHCNEPPAPLPAARVQPSAPFSVIGLDFAGPLFCADHPGAKYYILLITCGVVRAVHLELTESLGLSDFLCAFRRFCARRGVPSVVYSDNAKTFRAAARMMPEAASLVGSLFAGPAPQWRFNAPLAPWWGGFWERLVGSVKSCLRKCLGRRSLTRVELETVLIEVEGCVNSRPLTHVTLEEPEAVITPNHFLLGRSPNERSRIEDLSYPFGATDLQSPHAARMDALRHFWEIWSETYLKALPPLVSRFRTRGAPPIGSVVVIRNNTMSRLRWPLGRIVQTFRGRDGHIRAAELRTATGLVTRPIQALYDLEVSETYNQRDGAPPRRVVRSPNRFNPVDG